MIAKFQNADQKVCRYASSRKKDIRLSWLTNVDTVEERYSLPFIYQEHLLDRAVFPGQQVVGNVLSHAKDPRLPLSATQSQLASIITHFHAETQKLQAKVAKLEGNKDGASSSVSEEDRKAQDFEAVRRFLSSDSGHAITRKITDESHTAMFYKPFIQLFHQRILSEGELHELQGRTHIGYDIFCRPLANTKLDGSKDEFVEMIDDNLPGFSYPDIIASRDPPPAFLLPLGVPAHVLGQYFIPEEWIEKRKKGSSPRDEVKN